MAYLDMQCLEADAQILLLEVHKHGVLEKLNPPSTCILLARGSMHEAVFGLELMLSQD